MISDEEKHWLREWLEDQGIKPSELKELTLVIAFTVIVFTGILVIYPHTTMYQQMKNPGIIYLDDLPETDIDYQFFIGESDK